MIPKIDKFFNNADMDKLVDIVNQLTEAENKRLERGAKMAAGKAKKSAK